MTLDTKQAIASLSTPGKRVRVNDDQIVIKLPSVVKELVEGIAKGRDESAAAVWREAMGEYLAKRGYRA